MNYPLVKIEWIDITNENTWTEFDKLETDLAKKKKDRCFSVGWLYENSKEYVVIITSKTLDSSGVIENVSYEILPKGVVVSIKNLK